MIRLLFLLFLFSVAADLMAQQDSLLPFANELAGVNCRRTDDWQKAASVGYVREYHDWHIDIGFSTHPYPDCTPGAGKIKLNPGFDGGSFTKYDDMYEVLKTKIVPVLYGASPFKQGFTGYNGFELNEKKPVCPSETGYSFAQEDHFFYQMPAYRDYTAWLTVYAARYGVNPSWAENTAFTEWIKTLMHSSEPFPTLLGQGKMRYIEVWNEQDKTWREPVAEYRFTAPQYAALLSAAYDGHLGHAAFQVNNVPGFSSLGIKKADPAMRVVFGGLASLRGCYVEEVIDWSRQHRGTQARLPFDVVNFHHYNNTYFDYIEKTPEYVWNNYCLHPDAPEVQLGVNAVCPERAGMRERLKYSIQRLVEKDVEMAEKEFWLTETGYDTGPESPQGAKVPGISTYEAQAQWILRTFLETAAAVVTLPSGQRKGYDKVFIYDVRDAYSNTNYLFGTSGLFTDIPSGFAPKTSWYYLQTYKNVLNRYRFHSDLSAQQSLANDGIAVRAYAFRDSASNTVIALWSPTQTNVHLPVFRLILPENSSFSDSVTVNIPKAPALSGVVRRLPVLSDGDQRYVLFDSTTVQVSETPLFVGTHTMRAVDVPCPQLSFEASGCNGIRIKTHYAEGIEFDKYLHIYYSDSIQEFALDRITFYSNTVARKNNYLYIGGLQAGKTYTIWVVPSVQGQIPVQPCSITVTIPEDAPGHEITVAPSMVEDGCGLDITPDWSTARAMFDEPHITSCNAGVPLTAWQCPDAGQCSSCIVFEQPTRVDGLYFYTSAGVGTIRMWAVDVAGQTHVITEGFRVVTGMHYNWYHFSNFANGKSLKKIVFQLENDLKIGEIRLVRTDKCADNPPGPSPAPQRVVMPDEQQCHARAIHWHFPGGLPADLSHCTVSVGQGSPVLIPRSNADANEIFRYVLPVVAGQTYSVAVQGWDCSQQPSPALYMVVTADACDCTPLVLESDSLSCHAIGLTWNAPSGSCTALQSLTLYQYDYPDCGNEVAPTEEQVLFQPPAGYQQWSLSPMSTHLLVPLSPDRKYHFFLKAVYGNGAGSVARWSMCSPQCPFQAPQDCSCEPVDVSGFSLTQVSPVNQSDGLLLNDPCADAHPLSIVSVIDEQHKYILFNELQCEGLYPPATLGADYEYCPGDAHSFSWPLTEWFPGWNDNLYPATIRLATGGSNVWVNKIYLYDMNSSGVVRMSTEDEGGTVTEWGEITLSGRRKWVAAIDDPSGRNVRAVHFTRMSAGARFAEIGLCALTPERPVARINKTGNEARSMAAHPGQVLVLPVQEGPQSVRVVDVTGRMMYRQEVSAATIQLVVGNWPAGMYFLQEEWSEGVRPSTHKLIVFPAVR